MAVNNLRESEVFKYFSFLFRFFGSLHKLEKFIEVFFRLLMLTWRVQAKGQT